MFEEIVSDAVQMLILILRYASLLMIWFPFRGSVSNTLRLIEIIFYLVHHANVFHFAKPKIKYFLVC